MPLHSFSIYIITEMLVFQKFLQKKFNRKTKNVIWASVLLWEIISKELLKSNGSQGKPHQRGSMKKAKNHA